MHYISKLDFAVCPSASMHCGVWKYEKKKIDLKSIFRFWMITFLWLHHMAFTFRSQFVLHVFVIMCRHHELVTR